MRRAKFGRMRTQTGRVPCDDGGRDGVQCSDQSVRKEIQSGVNEQKIGTAGIIQGTKQLQVCGGNFAEK